MDFQVVEVSLFLLRSDLRFVVLELWTVEDAAVVADVDAAAVDGGIAVVGDGGFAVGVDGDVAEIDDDYVEAVG